MNINEIKFSFTGASNKSIGVGKCAVCKKTLQLDSKGHPVDHWNNSTRHTCKGMKMLARASK